MPEIGPSRCPSGLNPSDISRKDRDPADDPGTSSVDRAQEQEFLTGSRLRLVSTAFGIANVMVALDSSILGKGKHTPIHLGGPERETHVLLQRPRYLP